MCCCGAPVINGQMGYKWQPNDNPSIRPPFPPELEEGDTLLYDEPGRCGGLDAHSHHFRVVKHGSTLWLFVQHGGGKETIRLSGTPSFSRLLECADTTTRYWLLHAIYSAYSAGEESAVERTNHYWRTAAAEKRIKTRRQRGGEHVKVWVEPRVVAS